jgi:hypothetical protein
MAVLYAHHYGSVGEVSAIAAAYAGLVDYELLRVCFTFKFVVREALFRYVPAAPLAVRHCT